MRFLSLTVLFFATLTCDALNLRNAPQSLESNYVESKLPLRSLSKHDRHDKKDKGNGDCDDFEYGCCSHSNKIACVDRKCSNCKKTTTTSTTPTSTSTSTTPTSTSTSTTSTTTSTTSTSTSTTSTSTTTPTSTSTTSTSTSTTTPTTTTTTTTTPFSCSNLALVVSTSAGNPIYYGTAGTITCSISNIGSTTITGNVLLDTNPSSLTSTQQATIVPGATVTFTQSFTSLDCTISSCPTSEELTCTFNGCSATPYSLGLYICFAKGTSISLADGSKKNVEDINYNDNLLVWNFDEGKVDSALPLWIKKSQTQASFNLLEFSDGTNLKTVGKRGHRIFNADKGMFTSSMTDDTPIGTNTFNANGDTIKLVNKTVIFEQVEYYNLISDYHINVFANEILTSWRYSNLYEIKNMKYVKEQREFVPFSSFNDQLPWNIYTGLRLSEQTMKQSETLSHLLPRLPLGVPKDEL